jgi:hypothetical protein
MSRLKEAERVCGGRGQFGEQPLWDLNTLSELPMKLGRWRMSVLTNDKRSRQVECPVLGNGEVP